MSFAISIQNYFSVPTLRPRVTLLQFGLCATLIVAVAVSIGLGICSANLVIFLLACAGFVFACIHSMQSAAFYAIFYFVFKSALWRLAYHIDGAAPTSNALDALSFSGGLFLMVVCFQVIAHHVATRRNFVTNWVELSLIGFIGLNALSIFNPQSSIFIGLAGFERNVFPTMFLYFVGRAAVGNDTDLRKFLRYSLYVAAFCVIYGLRHSLLGLWDFEKTYFEALYHAKGLSGWLTIGVKGVEFRAFSTLWSYTEFTFTLAYWSIMLYMTPTDSRRLTSVWQRRLFFALTGVILLLSLERTPFLMIASGLIAASYVAASRDRRRTIALTTIGVTLVSALTLFAFRSQLEESGIAKFQRLSELADPSSASSIDDRMERMWKPALRTIASNPMGVGVGIGSQTVASSDAERMSGNYVQPHNEFLQKAMESGWLSALIFGVILITLFMRLRNASRSAHNAFRKRVLAAGCGVIVAFALCGMVNLPFSGACGNFMWFTSGALVSLSMSPPSELEDATKS